MPLDVSIFTDSRQCLEPYIDPNKAPMKHVNLAPGTYASGTVLGQITTGANDVQTITSTATGGSFAITFEYPIGNKQKTGALTASASLPTAASIQTALLGLSNAIPGGIAVTGSAGGPWTITFSGAYAGEPIQLMVIDNTLATGGTATIAHTTTGVTGGEFTAYASGNSDGSQVAKGLLKFAVVVDNEGQAGLVSSGTLGGQWSEKWPSVPMYIGGTFNTADLTGYDSTAESTLKSFRPIGPIGGPSLMQFGGS